MTSKMMGNMLIAQQHYLPSERKGLLYTVNIRVSTLVRLNLYENLSDDFTTLVSIVCINRCPYYVG